MQIYIMHLIPNTNQLPVQIYLWLEKSTSDGRSQSYIEALDK